MKCGWRKNFNQNYRINQLKNYVEDNGLQQNSTCMIYFSENRKKLEKEATKILSKYKRNRNTTVTRIDTDKFHFIKPEE